MVGGVLATQSYLRAARLATLANEGRAQLQAFRQFEQRYGGAVAGDMGNASSYWAAAANGDGNSMIYNGTNNNAERFYVYKHLQLAGLIAGSYSGVTGPGGVVHAIIGTNIPTTSVEQVGGMFASAPAGGYITGSGTYYDGYYGHYLRYGKAVTNSLPTGAFLSPAEAYELDVKFDNGQPSTGWIRGVKSASCISGTPPAYVGGNAADACGLVMVP